MNQYKHHTENSPTLATCLQAEVVLHERSFALERERGVRLVGIHDRKHRVAPSSAESRGNSSTSVVCERVASCSCTCLPQSTYGKLMVISATVPYLLGRPGYTAFHVASGSSNPPDAYMEEPQFWHSAIPGWSPRNVLVLAAEAVATHTRHGSAQAHLDTHHSTRWRVASSVCQRLARIEHKLILAGLHPCGPWIRFAQVEARAVGLEKARIAWRTVNLVGACTTGEHHTRNENAEGELHGEQSAHVCTEARPSGDSLHTHRFDIHTLHVTPTEIPTDERLLPSSLRSQSSTPRHVCSLVHVIREL